MRKENSPAPPLAEITPTEEKHNTELCVLGQFVTSLPIIMVSYNVFSTRHLIKNPGHPIWGVLAAFCPSPASLHKASPALQAPACPLLLSPQLRGQPVHPALGCVPLPVSSTELHVQLFPSGASPQCITLPQEGRGLCHRQGSIAPEALH